MPMKLISIFEEDHKKLMFLKVKNENRSVAEVIQAILNEIEEGKNSE